MILYSLSIKIERNQKNRTPNAVKSDISNLPPVIAITCEESNIEVTKTFSLLSINQTMFVILLNINRDYTLRQKYQGKYEEPCGKTAGYLNARSWFYHIRSLTPQQAAGNALAIRFKWTFSNICSNSKLSKIIKTLNYVITILFFAI